MTGLAGEKLGRAEDIRDSMAERITPRVWVGPYEDAADALGNLADALVILFACRIPLNAATGHPKAKADVLYELTARLLAETGQPAEAVGGIDRMRRLRHVMSTRNTSVHEASVLDLVGNEPTVAEAMADVAAYRDWLRATLRQLDIEPADAA